MVSDFCGVIGVTQKAAVVFHHKGSNHVQELLQFQIIVIPDMGDGELLAVDMGKADNAVAELLQRIGQKLRIFTLFTLGEQAGQRDVQYAVVFGNPNPLHNAGRSEIFGFF